MTKITKQTAAHFFKTISKAPLKPVYFLHGDETYYIDKIADYLESKVLSEAERNFNQLIVYGKDANLRQILEHANRYPIGAKRMVIMVKEAQDLNDLNRKEGRANLLNYIQKPVKSSIVVFTYKGKFLDGKTSLAKALTKHKMLIESKKLYDNQIFDWIQTYCRTHKIRIERAAIGLLDEYIGNNLNRIAKELNRIVATIGRQTRIEKATIEQYVSPDNNYNIFELQKALGQRQAAKAFQIIAKLDQKGDAIGLVSILYDYFSKLLSVYEHAQLSLYQIAEKTKLAPFRIKDYQKVLKFYSVSQILNTIQDLHQADLKLKGIENQLKESLILKELLCKILNSWLSFGGILDQFLESFSKKISKIACYNHILVVLWL